MARKSRKRRRGAAPRSRPAAGGAPPAQGTARSVATAPRRTRRPGPDDPPRAPWGSFPLVELVVLVAILMLIGGFIVSGTQGSVMIATGLVLGALGGLELSVREHFAGYRSHTALLAAAAAVATLALFFYALPDALPPPGRLAVAAVVGLLAGIGLARAFRARAGRTVKLR